MTRLATPHSCGRSCQRVRDSGCGHPCTLLCHPGPCPPCQVVTHLDCYCPRRVVLSFRCGVDIIGNGKRNLSCGGECGRLLGCGKHSCAAVCHEGDCAKCPEMEIVKCYCGREEKEVECGAGIAKECFIEGEEPWVGRYACDSLCQRYVLSFRCLRSTRNLQYTSGRMIAGSIIARSRAIHRRLFLQNAPFRLPRLLTAHAGRVQLRLRMPPIRRSTPSQLASIAKPRSRPANHPAPSLIPNVLILANTHATATPVLLAPSP